MKNVIFVKPMRRVRGTNFLDFEYVTDMIRSQNKGFINFGKISNADKNKIYFLLDKYKY